MKPAFLSCLMVVLSLALLLPGCANGDENDDTPCHYGVTVSASEGGDAFPSGTIQVATGTRLHVALTAHEGFELKSVTGCGGTREGGNFVTGPIDGDCEVQAQFGPPDQPEQVTITASASGDGFIEPSGAQSVAIGDSASFALQPRIAGCTIDIQGSCQATLDLLALEVTVTNPTVDCQLTVFFDCGPSSLEIWPEHIGVFWQNLTQQFTATQIFESGERVDVTDLAEWSSTDDTVVAMDASGLATALIDHGITDIKAELPGSASTVSAETSMTIVHVTTWHELFLTDVADYETGRVYLDNVVYAPGVLTWDWSPRDWQANTDGVSGRLWAIWSTDGGLSYEATAWDWIGNDSDSKGRSSGPTHSMWMGTMLTTVSDQPGGTFSNGKERTNIYFSPGVP